MSSIQYRADITGLRTVALLPVILFHAGVPLFAGGFVGVDVFFVISGYLMASIIMSERSAGTFSLAGFYERRARRILPALLVMLLICIPFAWFWMLPDSLENFGQSLVATTLSANNILLWLTSGYWDLASEFKPLLHTWSLGVEEQFYLLFPLLALLVTPVGYRCFFYIVVLVAAVSLLISEWGCHFHAIANFYLLPSRIWEFLAGSLCAIYLFRRAQAGNELLALIGLGLILISVFSFGQYTPFPSLYALLPVVGTMMVILFSHDGCLTAVLLSARWMVAIGLISYSAYLWHYPLFAFARTYSFSEPSMAVMLVLALLSLVFGWFSWRYVEQPFRLVGFIGLRKLSVLLLVVSSVIVTFGLYLHKSHGVPERIFDADNHRALAGMDISYNMRIQTMQKDAFPDNGKRNLLVIGNSFARDFVNAGLESGHFSHHNVVYRETESISGLANRHPDLVARADDVVFAVDSGGPAFWRRLIESFGRLGIDNYLIIGTKNFGYNLNAYVRLPKGQRIKARAAVLPDVLAMNEEMKSMIPAAHFVNVIAALADSNGELPVFAEDGFLISPDGIHLTRSGAAYVGKRIFELPQLEALR